MIEAIERISQELVTLSDDHIMDGIRGYSNNLKQYEQHNALAHWLQERYETTGAKASPLACSLGFMQPWHNLGYMAQQWQDACWEFAYILKTTPAGRKKTMEDKLQLFKDFVFRDLHLTRNFYLLDGATNK